MKKILLIHGWNYDNYHNRINHAAWDNRTKFVMELEKYYIVKKPDLPGFGVMGEPDVHHYTIEDYAKFIKDYIEKNDFRPDYILGYSFGGAVAVTYKRLFNKDAKLILVSPALIRNKDNSKKYMNTPKIFDPIRNKIRDLYLIKKVKVPEMVYGTKFLRNTYQSIVRVEIISYLEEIKDTDFIIIYGSQDKMVDPNRMINEVSDRTRKRIKFIQDGGHDIANTHTRELVKIINNYVDSKN